MIRLAILAAIARCSFGLRSCQSVDSGRDPRIGTIRFCFPAGPCGPGLQKRGLWAWRSYRNDWWKYRQKHYGLAQYRLERLRALTQDRQVGVVGEQPNAPPACDLPGDAEPHQGFGRLAYGGEAHAEQLLELLELLVSGRLRKAPREPGFPVPLRA